MHTDTKVLLGFGATIFTLITLAVMLSEPVEAPAHCYANLPQYYTWTELKPLVDEVTKDRFLSDAECVDLHAEYKKAAARKTKENLMKAFEASKK